MFDIGFWELVVIAIVALVVVGPERLPGMIRKMGYWVGQFRRMASTVKNEFEQEVGKAEHLQNMIEEQKRIVERHVNVDLNKPAVNPVAQESSTPQVTHGVTSGSETVADGSANPPNK